MSSGSFFQRKNEPVQQNTVLKLACGLDSLTSCKLYGMKEWPEGGLASVRVWENSEGPAVRLYQVIRFLGFKVSPTGPIWRENGHPPCIGVSKIGITTSSCVLYLTIFEIWHFCSKWSHYPNFYYKRWIFYIVLYYIGLATCPIWSH